jgi:hypothetical protein
MATIHIRGQAANSIFDLIGRNENALTFALGWCLAKVPRLRASVAAELGALEPGNDTTILLQEHLGANGITDVEVRDPGRVAWIIEAKIGFDPPSLHQLTKYARAIAEANDNPAEKLLIVLAKSDRRNLWLQSQVPEAVEGIPVRIMSWGRLRSCMDHARATADHAGKRLLDEVALFLDEVLDMQIMNSNSVYVVSLNRDTFGGGPTTFLDVVVTFRKYLHPVGSGWPVNPPNYIGFRCDGKLLSIHHVDSYEIITSFAPHFPDITEGEIRPHFLYTLGRPITPQSDVRTGDRIRQANRVYADIDLLLTSATISEAFEETKARRDAALQ